ncbi:MAG: hypothetical protein HY255_01540 [Betaproteobacteria bacterium]|nr:hypothetical protein [Betaproteobacteria bacterium]
MWTRLLSILVVLAGLTGCVTSPAPSGDARDATAQSCATWFAGLDDAVDRAGVRDAEAHRLPGFPYLRSDRLLASLGAGAAEEDRKYSDWLAALRELDRRGRAVEAYNLPAGFRAALQMRDATMIMDRSEQCAQAVLPTIAAERTAIVAAAAVPDDYSSLARAIGLYLLTSSPFYSGVVRWQEETHEAFRRAADPAVPQPRSIRFQPQDAAPDAAVIARLLREAPRDALGLAHYADGAADVLLAAFAPTLEIDAMSNDDLPGTIFRKVNGVVTVDTARPAAYQRIAQTRIDGRAYTQLVYTFWFANRPPSQTFDLLAGQLDAVVIRITIDGDGVPLMVDSIHACGCFHQFFPSSRMIPRAAPTERIEWAFVPVTLPKLAAGTRLMVRVASGSHSLMRITAADAGEARLYRLLDEASLRTLPTTDGGSKSLYGPDGLVAGSERGERFLFWPMGINSVGAMRQWGHHATAFVGRRHFDDADLLEKRFQLTP